MGKLRRAVDVESALLGIEDHGQRDDQGMASDVGDMPLVTVLDVAEQYLLQVHPTLFLSFFL